MIRDGAVLCVGRVYCDLVFTGVPRDPVPGQEVFATGLSAHAGGGAAITAGWLRALGRRSELCAYLPAAPFDGPVMEELAAAGVGRSLCAAATGTEPQVTVAMVRGEDRAFLTRAPGPAAPPLDASALHRLGVTHLHVGELATLVARPELIAVARRAGATISADCGWDDGLRGDCAELIGALDVFLPNEAEAARLVSLGLSARPAPLTVVKRGARGGELRRGGGTVARPASAAEVVDSTGAGDAFDAGFLASWLDGATPETALEAGIACGTRAVTRTGGLGAAAVPQTA